MKRCRTGGASAFPGGAGASAPVAAHLSGMNQSRQPKGIPVGGQFAASARAESTSIDLMDDQGPDLSTWAPAEVDTELARLYGEIGILRARRDSMADFVNREIARHRFNRGFRGSATPAEMRDVLAEIAETPEAERHFKDREIYRRWEEVEGYDAKIDDLTMQMEPYDDEFARRGGWTRAFLVTNTGGHVHKDMNCSSCFPDPPGTTGSTEMSDKTEDEIIDAAGSNACTICYPHAPVEKLLGAQPTGCSPPTRSRPPRTARPRAEAKKVREAAKIAKALTPDGSELEINCTRNGYPQRERFKTEQAATSWMVSNLADYQTWNKDSEMDLSMIEAHEQIINAIAAKHDQPVEDVRAEIVKKTLAKIKRDAR